MQSIIRLITCSALLWALLVGPLFAADEPQADPEAYRRRETWARTMADTRRAWLATTDRALRQRVPLKPLEPLKRDESRPEPLVAAMEEVSAIAQCLWRDFPHQMDWVLQDNSVHRGWGAGKYDARGDLAWYLRSQRDNTWERKLVDAVLAELDKPGLELTSRRKRLTDVPPGDGRWLALYDAACRARRLERLAPLLARTRQVIFAKHHPFGSRSGIYLITETEGCLSPGDTALCSLDLSCEVDASGLAEPEVLFDPQGGIVRDPDLHFDAGKLLFAWRKTRDHWDTRRKSAPEEGNYQIYEMDLTDRSVRQLTTDDYYGAAFEPCYLPDGNIMFSSSRIVQHITCGWGDCSNLFLMDGDGRYQRRVGFDQTNTAFPELLDDGRVIFTRRDYNDRGQVYAHGLFVMNPDATLQREYYGNNTVHPTSFQHARSIPGTGKVLCVIGGYHTSQGGKLAILDVRDGYQGFEGLTIIPPGESVEGTGGDRFGKIGAQYANPDPMDERSCLVSIAPIGGYGLREDGKMRIKTGYRHWFYNVYYMTFDGRRELLAADAGMSCLQPIAVRKRPRPPVLTSSVDWSRDDAVMYVQDVYVGDGLTGVGRGEVKKLRVVALKYKPLTTGGVVWRRGRGGYGHSVTPVALPSGTYDAKAIIGEAKVHPDGSAMFRVPARTPLYLQALDEHNRVIQTMRSWATLMPGENFSCVGCHERKYETPVRGVVTDAMRAGATALEPFYGPTRGFSYRREIQPILDKHCVKCHKPENADKAGLVLTGQDVPERTSMGSAGRIWPRSYLELTGAVNEPLPAGEEKAKAGPGHPDGELVNWLPRLAIQTLRPPREHGSVKSKLWSMLHKGHKKVKLSREELDKIAAWIDLGVPLCGDYSEANNWSRDQRDQYRRRMDLRRENEQMEADNIRRMLAGEE